MSDQKSLKISTLHLQAGTKIVPMVLSRQALLHEISAHSQVHLQARQILHHPLEEVPQAVVVEEVAEEVGELVVTY